MKKILSIVSFLLCFFIITLISKQITGNWFPDASLSNIWFYSGIIMVLFSIFFIEPYYTAPTNVISNAMALALVFLSIHESIKSIVILSRIWFFAVGYLLLLILISLLSSILSSSDVSEDHWQNKLSNSLKSIAVSFGNGKVLFSGVFLMFILYYQGIQKLWVLLLMIFWWLIVVINPAKLINTLNLIKKKSISDIGTIFGVQSKRMFLAKLHKNKRTIVKRYDMVLFNYSVESYSAIFEGIIFDTYLLNQERWIRILQLSESPIDNKEINISENKVCKIEKSHDETINKIVDRFIGTVIENTEIGTLKFECAAIKDDPEEGDILEVTIGRREKKIVYYQVVNAITSKQVLEAKNETGFIKAESIQLGTWNNEKCCFEKYGWVPQINNLVLKALSEKPDYNLKENEFVLGIFPKTQLPAIVDLNHMISHHTAILGITGAGKSFIALEIVKNIITNIKVICIDFTGEYIDKLSTLSPIVLFQNPEPGQKSMDDIEKLFADKNQENRQRYPDKEKINGICESINAIIIEHVNNFMESENKLSLFELPDMSNASYILEFTQMFLDAVFKYEKEHQDSRVCIIIEEAHTVVPETTSLGDFGDYSSNKALVNKIGQIALQGRKYGVGFIIIAQRTANVSKTVLTQCNSIICFQAFDNTSFDFLGNYLGKELVHALPNLKQYHAIIVGKAVKSNIPMIVDLTRDIS